MTEEPLPVAATVVLVRDGAAGPEVLMLRRPDRGSFAAAWVFPGGKLEERDYAEAGADADELAVSRLAAVRETHEEVGLHVAADALVPLSRWVPPQHTTLRIRTWFFVAPAPAGEIVPQPSEVDEYAWLSPLEALQRHGRGELILWPPTWVTLWGLSDQADAASALAEARLNGLVRFDTEFAAGGKVVRWAGDEEHSDAGAPGARHRLTTDALPWIYTRSR